MSNPLSSNALPAAYLVRQGSPTIDGSDDVLYFLKDPQTGLRVRLPRHVAGVFTALQSTPTASIEEVRAFTRANFGAELSEAEAIRSVQLVRSLDLASGPRNRTEQLVSLYREQVGDKKQEVLRRLPELVATVPFYQDYGSSVEAFEALPIIGKTDLRRHVHRLYIPAPEARYRWMSSSGTTDERVQAPLIQESFRDELMPHLAVGDPGIDSDSRSVTFLPAECGGMSCNMNPDIPMAERISGNRLFAPQLGNPSVARRSILEQTVREIVEWQPTFITGAASFIYAFARYAESISLKLSTLRAIFYHVEPPSLIHARTIEAVLGAPGRSLYIASELGWVAIEGAPGKLFASSKHIVEVIRDGRPVRPGEVGHVVVTTMSYGSPVLLRYDTRDLARLHDDGVTISRIIGRQNTALIRRADGATVTTDLVDALVDREGGSAVAFYRLYRRGPASAPRFAMDCCPSGGGDAEQSVRAIAEGLRELLGAAVDVRLTSGIPPHRGGRMPLFLDEGE